MQTITTLKAEASLLTLEGFVERYPAPALVIEAQLSEPGVAEGFFTVDASVTSAELGEPRVAHLVKRENGNPFAMMITVGRAANNDVVVAGPGISKFHAFVARSIGDDAWSIADAGSTYGTYLEGKQLEARVRYGLFEGARVDLGRITATFHTPSSLYALLSNAVGGLRHAS